MREADHPAKVASMPGMSDADGKAAGVGHVGGDELHPAFAERQ